MKRSLKCTIPLIVILLLLIPNILPISAYTEQEIKTSEFEEKKELYLMRSEHYLHVNATEDVDEFNLRFVFPPDYQYQVPIYLEIHTDTTAEISNYKIQDDKNEPNKVINFTINSVEKYENIMIHFSCWVFVQNHEFNDLPKKVKFPKKSNLPQDTKTWLKSSSVVQKNRLLIKLRARQLKGLSDNLIRFAGRVAKFIKNHRFGLFLIQLSLRIFFSQDAFTTLLINGENVGRAHLACAFFRGFNVPARVLLVHNDQGFWTQMHFMVEYYCPGYGWVLIDPTFGKTPYSTKKQIINRICFPEDEEDTKRDYVYSTMRGEERWIWIDNEYIKPVYIDCNEGSKSQMFYEGNIEIDEFTADYAFLQAHLVYYQYEKYLGKDLSVHNQEYFQNALEYQTSALQEFSQSNIQAYIENMYLAYQEYLKIDE